MERSRAPWYVGLPLLSAAWLAAHGLAYELLPPEGEHEAAVGAGHTYLEQAPVALAALLTVAAAALLVRVAQERAAGSSFPAWLCGTLPLVAFAAQEHVERILQGAEAPWLTLAEPVVLLGLALQLPFGLAAALVAWAAVETATGIAAAPTSRPPRHPALLLLVLPDAVDVLRPPALAARLAERGPPARR